MAYDPTDPTQRLARFNANYGPGTAGGTSGPNAQQQWQTAFQKMGAPADNNGGYVNSPVSTAAPAAPAPSSGQGGVTAVNQLGGTTGMPGTYDVNSRPNTQGQSGDVTTYSGVTPTIPQGGAWQQGYNQQGLPTSQQQTNMTNTGQWTSDPAQGAQPQSGSTNMQTPQQTSAQMMLKQFQAQQQPQGFNSYLQSFLSAQNPQQRWAAMNSNLGLESQLQNNDQAINAVGGRDAWNNFVNTESYNGGQ